MEDRKTFAAKDGGEIFPVDVAAEFTGQKAGVKSIGIVIDRRRKVIGVHDIPVDKDNFSLFCRQVTVRRMHLIRTLVYIVQLDPVVPVPGNMMSRKQPAFIIVTHKGKPTGIF